MSSPRVTVSPASWGLHMSHRHVSCKLPLTECPLCQVHRLSATLGDLLQEHESQLSPGALPFAKPLKMERKESERPEASLSSEEETAGVENIKSLTYSKDLLGPQPHSQPGAGGFAELQSLVPEPSKEEQSLPAGAREVLGDGLQLEVKPSEEEAWGYIVTDRE
ncbi:Receptor-type tyrosine-protein phosphatase N2 [Saguinus oedipus]|uniref:Receptor-type tyrosine-protein phosphatase N2 n=1 Tax=Saguinus oedipus TaxID=9490 RepID=A0ABQ9ULH0_SAGOE|nr:Receptor-type tyrosine-protein phosphatase N2 [Saguinus oedipus]